MLLYALPGALIKYQIATYLYCNPQDAFHKVKESSWESQSLLHSPNNLLIIQALFYGHHDLSLSQSLLQCSRSVFTIQAMFFALHVVVGGVPKEAWSRGARRPC